MDKVFIVLPFLLLKISNQMFKIYLGSSYKVTLTGGEEKKMEIQKYEYLQNIFHSFESRDSYRFLIWIKILRYSKCKWYIL